MNYVINTLIINKNFFSILFNVTFHLHQNKKKIISHINNLSHINIKK